MDFDEKAPCIMCGEPVIEPSMGGTTLCPWCDCGKCRYCGVKIFAYHEEIDGGRSLKNLREHMDWHKKQKK